MAAVSFLRPLFLVTLFITALTSSVSVGPDGTSSVPSVLGQDPPFKPPSSTVKQTPDTTNDEKPSWPHITSKVSEGGPITDIEDAAKTKSDKPDESRARENVPKERNASPSVVPRKGVEEKIKARKGVDQDMDPEQINISFNQTTSEDTKPVMKTISTIEAAHIKNQSETYNINTLKLNTTKLNTTNSSSSDSLDHSINTNYSSTSLKPANATISHIEITNNTVPKISHIEKHIPKPKPTVTTVDGPEVYESRPSSQRKNPSLGIPRKIDYIVPVIITIIALPILGAAIFVLYRRGRDCWDKRHYRRMDFLIDGMYND